MSEINSKSLSLLLQVQTAIAYCDAGIESGAVSVKFDEGTYRGSVFPVATIIKSYTRTAP